MYPEIYPETGKVYDNDMNFLGKSVFEASTGNTYIMVKFAYNQFLLKGEGVVWDDDFIATSAVGGFSNGILAANVNTLDLSSGEYYYAFVVTKSTAVDVSYGGAVAVASDVTNKVLSPVVLATGTYCDGLLKESSVKRTITGTVATAATGVVTGTSTLFTTELAVGDILELPGASVAQYGVVVVITSDTSLQVDNLLTVQAVAAAAYVVKDIKGALNGSVIGNGTVGYSDEYDEADVLGTLTTSTTTATLTSDYSALKLFRIGDYITADGESRIIDSITNATTFTISVAFTADLAADTYTVKRKSVNCRMGM